MSAMQSNDPDGRVGVCLQSRSSEGIAASSHIIPRKHMSDLFVSDKLPTETRDKATAMYVLNLNKDPKRQKAENIRVSAHPHHPHF